MQLALPRKRPLALPCKHRSAGSAGPHPVSQHQQLRHAPKAAARTLFEMEQAGPYKERVREMFDKGCQRYDAANDAFHPPLAARLVEVCGIQEGESVLDLASGTGLVSVPAAQLVGPAGHVVALDLSSGMLEVQRSKLQELGLTNVQLVQGDVDTAQLASGPFDLVVSCSALPYFNDIPHVLQRCVSELLKPGPSSRLAFQCFQAPMNLEYGLLCDMAQRVGGFTVHEPNIRLGTRAACAELCAAAGLEVVHYESEERVIWEPAPDVQHCVEALWSRAARSPFWPQDAPPEAVQRLRQEFIPAACSQARTRFSTREDGSTGVVCPYTSMYIVAGRCMDAAAS